MVQTPLRLMSLAEFLDLPETKPASEYSDGQILQKPMPQGEHSAIPRQDPSTTSRYRHKH